MARRPRPSLTLLSSPGERDGTPGEAAPRLTDSGDAAPASSGPEGAGCASAAAEGSGAARLCLDEGAWRQVAGLARSLGVSPESLIGEAIDDLLVRHRRPPPADGPRPEPEPAAHPLRAAFEMALWPTRVGSLVWYHTVGLPALESWGRWTSLAGAGLPGRERGRF